MSATKQFSNTRKASSRTTRKPATAKAVSPMRKTQHAKGAALAIKMLRELEGTKGVALEAYFAQDREPGTKQRNIVLEVLDAIGDNREVRAGFASILSDYIAGAANGVVQDAVSYGEGGDHA